MDTPNFDPEEKRQELQEGAEADKKHKEQTTASVLESVKEGVEYSETETEWVELGACAFEVETDIPSSVRHAFEHIDDQDPQTRTRTSDLIESLPEIIVRIDDPEAGMITDRETITDILFEFDRQFKTAVFMEQIIEPLLSPALENMEERLPQSFRRGRGGGRNGRVRNNRQ